MKKIWIGFLVSLLGVFFSCATMQDKNKVEGKVELVEFAKDGYTAIIKTTKNETYSATISMINLGGRENYMVFKVGDQVVVKGEIWKTNVDKYIKVEKIISVR